jgi:hypothetical protein
MCGAASKGLTGHRNLWKSGHKPQKTGIKIGLPGQVKGEETSNGLSAFCTAGISQTYELKRFISARISP